MAEIIRFRPDIEEIALEHDDELKKPVEARKITRLQRFLLALKGIQALDHTNSKSFYWLASYHGGSSPQIYAEQRRLAGKDAPKELFCAHGIEEFPSWHRIYLYLFEKSLQEIDPEVMLPYWNQLSQSSKSNGLPTILQLENIELIDGTSIANPLRRYKLQDSVFHKPVGEVTERELDDLGTYLSTEHAKSVKLALNLTKYDEFCNHSSSNWSLESAHDSIHVYVGGFMGDPTTAAFDPVFWLHHCYTDYLFWIWQLKHNQTSKLNTKRGTFKLIPFKNEKDQFYTVQDSANIANFNYNYPEFDLNTIGIESRMARRQLCLLKKFPLLTKDQSSKRELRVDGIEFAKFGGAFRVKAYAYPPSGKVYLGVYTVFRFEETCENCQVRNTVNAGFDLKSVRREDEDNLEFKIKFEMREGVEFEFTIKMEPGIRYIERRYGGTFELRY